MRRTTAALAAAFLALAFAVPATAKPVKAPDLRAQIAKLEAAVTNLQKLAATVPTLSQAIDSLGERVTALEHAVDRLGREHLAVPEVARELDRLHQRVTALEQAVAGLRTRVADLETAPATAPGGGVSHDRAGFSWSAADHRYGVTIGGYAQPRYALQLTGGKVDASTFSLDAARLGVGGHLGHRLSFYLQAQLDETRPLLDYWGNYRITKWLKVIAGQFKVPYTRNFLTSRQLLAFDDRPEPIEAFRYSWEPGAAVHGRVAGGRLGYVAGASNGAGPNALNDNIDVAAWGRVDAAVVGKRFPYSVGDVAGTPHPALMLGAGAVHDLIALPRQIAGISVGNRDVDGNGTTDNVRVLSASADADLRYRGFELIAEGLFRREWWGTILRAPQNSRLAKALHVDPNGPGNTNARSLFGGYAEASYMAIPHRLLVGGRVGYAENPLLEASARQLVQAPPAQNELTVDGIVRWYSARGLPLLGLQYTFFHFYGDKFGGVAQSGHRIILEAQVSL